MKDTSWRDALLLMREQVCVDHLLDEDYKKLNEEFYNMKCKEFDCMSCFWAKYGMIKDHHICCGYKGGARRI